MKTQTLNFDEVIKRLGVYLPVAVEVTNTNPRQRDKLFNKVNRVLDKQPIADATVVLAFALGNAVNYWHKKQPLQKQRKPARKAA